jgi:hypothetical protein
MQDGDVSGPLAVSIVASLVLTIVLNVLLWMFPGRAARLWERLNHALEARQQRDDDGAPSNVRVIVPWKLMLIVSLILTLLLNVVLLARR